jgi:hypothetical protein
MKKTMLILLAAVIGLIPSSLRAQMAPNVSISLSFSHDYYSSGQPVLATITMTNNGDPIYLNSDFIGRGVYPTPGYYLELKITDPAGRVVRAKRPAEGAAPHRMQPLPFRCDSGTQKVYEEAPCSPLAHGGQTIPAAVDLRPWYDLSIPGRYLAQVQLSAMQFADDTCNVGTYLWQGLLESNVATFYMAGDTQVSVNPNVWPLTWKSAPVGTNTVTATLTPPTGVPVDRLETRAIYLNDVYGEGALNGDSVVVRFDGKEAVNSLGPGPIERGNAYKVRVAGWYKGGGYFGGITEIQVLEFHFDGFFSPVENPPRVNSAKAGKAILVKWRLTDGAGNPVSDTASFVSLASTSVNCHSLTTAAESTVEEVFAAGSSSLQYLGDGNWQHNWMTPKSYANTCRIMNLKLKDGSSYTANFKFMK